MSPKKQFSLKSAYKKLTKNKKNIRPTDPNIFWHVSGNTGIFFRPNRNNSWTKNHTQKLLHIVNVFNVS